jgi:DNA primase
MDRKRLEDVLTRLGITDILDYGDNLNIPCLLAPWRMGHSSGSDHSGSMGIRINKDGESSVHCFSCKFGGTLTYLIMKYAQLSKRKDLVDLISEVEEIEAGDPVQLVLGIGNYGDTDTKALSKDVVLCEGILRMLFEEKRSMKYLENRGIREDTLDYWGCLYDKNFQRVVFPVRISSPHKFGCDRLQTLVGAIGRSIGGVSKAKYFNYFKFSKMRYFFGENLATPNTQAIVVEGVLDTVAVWQALKDAGKLEEYSVLGLMGSEASAIQQKRLCEEYSSVVSFFDNDPPGWTGQRRLIKDIQERTLLRGVKYPVMSGMQGGDPAKLVQDKVDVVRIIEESRLLAV